MVKNKRAFFFALMTVMAVSFLAPAVFAQDGVQTGVSLEAEIQSIERSVNRQGIPATERHAGLVRLARLRQLSGDTEGAARNWLDAAGAIPGRVDDDALLNCAYCLAAMGEWDRARTALEPLLSKSARARFLRAGISAVADGNTAALLTLADNSEYDPMKSEIYFLLWRVSSGPAAERWRQRLVNEFPQSPEARLATNSEGRAETIALRQNPFWLFMGGFDSLSILPGETEGKPSASTAQTPAMQTPAVQTPSAQIPPAPESYVRLQTGIYSQQPNAQTQAERLRRAGFTPTIEERVIGSSLMWAVTVPAGDDQNRTLAELREKGFDAFPLR